MTRTISFNAKVVFLFPLFSSKPRRLEIDIDKSPISELSIQSFQTKDWE